MQYEYSMVQVPPNIEIKRKEYVGNEAAFYLQSVTNERATQGWEFYRVDTIGVQVKPGCLGALLGQRTMFSNFYVITFRRPRTP
jgi:hypothetical protein